MFSSISKNFNVHMLLAFSLVLVASLVGKMFRKNFIANEHTDDYELVKTYLLNDSALYGRNRPKIWIHSKYEINARKWKNFMSRTSTDLNQPYLYLTIQSIINHCGEDFHVCLIDDESFEKLIPTWSTNLATVPEPMRSRMRDKGMIELLYIYGGMIVPNSFLCLQPMIDLYRDGIKNKIPFVAEKRMTFPNATQSKPFLPDMYFMGAEKEDPMILKMSEEMTLPNHFQNEYEFSAKIQKWLQEQVHERTFQLLEGEKIGIKTRIGKPVLLEHLMSDAFLDLDEKNVLYGIYIPADEILRRKKYQYFAILPADDVLKTDTILTKYFKVSIVDNREYVTKDKNSLMSLVAI